GDGGTGKRMFIEKPGVMGKAVGGNEARRRRCIVGIVSGDDAKQDRRISDGPCQWSSRILIRSNRKDPIATYQPKSWFDTDHIVGGARAENRTRCFSSYRHRH